MSQWWWTAVVSGGALAMGLAGCSPTHNWREVRHEGTPLQAMMPCKPERAEREVPLLGPEQPAVLLRMMSCDVSGTTFALAALKLPNDTGSATPVAATAVLPSWARATWASLQQTVPSGAAHPEGWQMTPVEVSGAAWAQRWSGPALNHQRQSLPATVLWAGGGSWVVQAAIYGPVASTDVETTFFEGVKLP